MSGKKHSKMRCKVAYLIPPLTGNPDWDKHPWKEIPPQLIQNYMGEKPDHFPRTEVKIAYDGTALNLLFQVSDRYVRAVATGFHGNVWEDSCVKFFFTPGSDLSKGYFNLETNCGGTMLFHFHPGHGRDRIIIPENDCRRIKIAHSLPQRVDPEINEAITWSVAYKIPVALLKKYCQVTVPSPKAEWRANFYKCADKSSHPHWLTWAPVDFPKPNFHLPQFFGTLEF